MLTSSADTRKVPLVSAAAVVVLVLTSCSGDGHVAAPTTSPTARAEPISTAIATLTEVLPVQTSVPVVATTVPSATSSLAPSVTPVPPTPISTDTAEPSATPSPTEVLRPTSTPTTELPPDPNPAVGADLWARSPCMGCHGVGAEGDFGPRLAGTGLSLDQVLSRVRLGKGQMPAFSEAEISDLFMRHVYAWLRSLAQPTPTPVSPPSFSTQALSEMWYYVNEMRIRADFAKDLPVRVASDEAGRLNVVKQYSGDGLDQVAQVLDRANRALNDVPSESVKAIIREIIVETNAVANYFDQARAAQTYDTAWVQVAEAVRTCRIDTLPWATQAIRDSGLVGAVRIQVVDQSGEAISRAFATALTAHTPLGSTADEDGFVTFVNVAAVPALPVKAYADGRVYHEMNVNLSPGATVEGRIALPPIPGGNLAPSVADAVIEPAFGSGDATVTFVVTAADPQGRLDLAEDQIFALNPDVGLAYVLLYAGGNRYQLRKQLPDLGPGLHTWYFFAVDHECHTSNIIPVRYRVQ